MPHSRSAVDINNEHEITSEIRKRHSSAKDLQNDRKTIGLNDLTLSRNR